MDSITLTPVPVFDMAIFGGTGDLAMRKLLPSLYRRFAAGQIPDASRIIGVARKPLSRDTYRERVKAAIATADAADANTVDRFLALVDYRSLDATADDGWDDFATHLHGAADGTVRVFYLSTTPRIYVDICQRLQQHDLNDAQTRIVVEKPIGHDGASARAINDALGKVFGEKQIFRIDHYLGKETVQNLLALRFANALFEPLWNAAHIDHIQISVAETVGVEQRSGYYDRAGALRDMVQNHLLQLLCMVAMEPPASLAPDAVRDEKLKVLRSLRPIDGSNAARVTVRGQYRAGAGLQGAVPGYLEDIDNDASRTETFVALKVEVDNWRWSGVPFYLRTGKRLPLRESEIVVYFRSIPHSIFGARSGSIAPNRLVLRLQPDEGVKLWMMVKSPTPEGIHLNGVPLDMSFAKAFGTEQPGAYERLILDVVRGDPTLFMRRDEIEAAWRWIDPIHAAWQADDHGPHGYTAGTWGPNASVALIERDGHSWHDDEQSD